MDLENVFDFDQDSSAGLSKSKHPSPADLDIYLPWACSQLQCKYTLAICRTVQVEYVSQVQTSVKKGTKAVKSKKSASLSDEDDTKTTNKMVQSTLDSEPDTIRLLFVYDQADHLVQLKFFNNTEIPRTIFQILGLIAQFQKFLTTITINCGIDMYCLYEIAKFLPHSLVTELVLDNAFVKEGNYSILLEESNLLKRLSLSRCKINDDVLKTIADKLVHPLPASKTLIILDVSTNKITDVGANYLALALRSNRRLGYLNISDNILTDIGGESILNSLMDFPLTDEELVSSKKRLMNYYRQRNEHVTTILKQLRNTFDSSKNKRKSVKEKQVGKKHRSAERLDDAKDAKSLYDFDHALHEKAYVMAEDQMGRFSDPFTKNNLITRDGVVYCLGNNTLCYLNMSYNNLTYITVRKLLDVVQCQKDYNRSPIGLITVGIDGNYLPVSSLEIVKIDSILSSGFVTDVKNAVKKRPGPKTGTSRAFF